jgi:hypothetical protein
VGRAILARKDGCGPDRILFMVSTCESHHPTNWGLSLDEYWKMCEYCYRDPSITGLVSTEDLVVVTDEIGIETGIDVDMLLETGRMVERIVGRRLLSTMRPHRQNPKIAHRPMMVNAALPAVKALP